MHRKRLWLRPVSAFFVAATMGLLAWGILGGGLAPGPPAVMAPPDPAGTAPARVAPGTAQGAQGVRWCDEGLGCNDA